MLQGSQAVSFTMLHLLIRCSTWFGVLGLSSVSFQWSNSLIALNHQVIVVLTDAGFASSENVTLPEAQLQTAGVKVLIYKLPQANDNNVYLSNVPLLGSLCRIGGTFEVIEQDLDNPLYAIKSYFSYLASTHMVATAVARKPLWSSLYLDFDEISKYITTVTFPGKILQLWNPY